MCSDLRLIRVGLCSGHVVAIEGHALLQVPSDASETEVREAISHLYERLARTYRESPRNGLVVDVESLELDATALEGEPLNVIVRDENGSLIVRE